MASGRGRTSPQGTRGADTRASRRVQQAYGYYQGGYPAAPQPQPYYAPPQQVPQQPYYGYAPQHAPPPAPPAAGDAADRERRAQLHAAASAALANSKAASHSSAPPDRSGAGSFNQVGGGRNHLGAKFGRVPGAATSASASVPLRHCPDADDAPFRRPSLPAGAAAQLPYLPPGRPRLRDHARPVVWGPTEHVPGVRAPRPRAQAPAAAADHELRPGGRAGGSAETRGGCGELEELAALPA